MKKFNLLLLFLLNLQLHAREIVVCKACEVTSVKAAVEMAEEGDLIRIKKGIYKENDIRILHKSISIIGEEFPVIDAEMKGTAFSIQADNVSLEGLRIINIGKSHTSNFAAVLMAHSKNFRLVNNRLENVFFGFLIEKSSNGLIRGNTISSNATEEANSGNGIHMWHSDNIRISNNTVSGTRDGIYLEFTGNSVITGNFCSENLRYGLHFMFSDHNKYRGNIFERNGAGVAVMYSKHIEMHRNIFRKNWGSAAYGLLLKEISDAELRHNVFEGNTVAISADGTTRISYVENNFVSNGYGVKVRGGCYNNAFERNNFEFNAFDLSYTGAINGNSFSNNYWSEYRGYDLDKNGTGDVPHRPVKLFSYLVNQSPETIVLLRSLFIGLVDFSEKVSPIFTPADLTDTNPQMKRNKW